MGVTNDGRRAPAVRRAVAALEMLALQGAAAPADLARELGLAKSSTSDLVGTLLAEGLVGRRGDELVVGPLLGILTAGFVGDEGILSRFATDWLRHPLLTDHTVSVQSIAGRHSLCVDVRLGRHLLPYTPRAGRRTDIWTEAGGEPVLGCLSQAAVRRSLEAFSGFDDAIDVDALIAWMDEHADHRGRRARLASTGNLEICAPVASLSPEAPPVVLSLHLPPRFADDSTEELRGALQDFADTIGN